MPTNQQDKDNQYNSKMGKELKPTVHRRVNLKIHPISLGIKDKMLFSSIRLPKCKFFKTSNICKRSGYLTLFKPLDVTSRL